MLVLFVFATVALGHAWFRFPNFIVDEALVTFRYAERFGEGRGLTWTPGPPVEGYSNLLWVLILAAAHAVGISPETAARGLGMAGLLALVVLLTVDPIRFQVQSKRLWAGAAAAGTGGFAMWSMGGLENTVVAALVVGALVVIERAAVLPNGANGFALILGALVAIRSDGFVLAGALLGFASLRSRSIRPWFVAAATVVGVTTVIQIHRQFQYGESVATLLRFVATLTTERSTTGMAWLSTGIVAHGALFAGGFMALWPVASRPTASAALGVAAIWCAFMSLAGGDSNGGWFQMLPALGAVLYAASAGLAEMSRPLPWWIGVLALSAHLPLANTTFNAFDGNQQAPDERRARPIATAMKAAWGNLDPLLAVDEAGALPYYTGFRALDMQGNNDATIRQYRLDTHGDDPDGEHVIIADHVWGAEPDLVAWNGALGDLSPVHGTGELSRKPGFDRRYTPIRVGALFRGGWVSGWYFVRRDSGPLGLTRTKDRVEIPAWFFASPGSNPAIWRNDLFAPFVQAEKPGKATGISLAIGHWQVSAAPSAIEVRVRCGAATSLWEEFVYVRLDAPGQIDIEVRAESQLQVRSVTVERVEDRPERVTDTVCSR